MNTLKLISATLIITLAPAAMAKTAPLSAKCESVAQEAAVKANKKFFGAETSGCGSKLLHLGDQLETYLVCVTDETDPSEWIVAVERAEHDKKTGKTTAECVVKYSGYAVDAATPYFAE
jgi:hypothetical protein